LTNRRLLDDHLQGREFLPGLFFYCHFAAAIYHFSKVTKHKKPRHLLALFQVKKQKKGDEGDER
jgi:hypothetical protein